MEILSGVYIGYDKKMDGLEKAAILLGNEPCFFLPIHVLTVCTKLVVCSILDPPEHEWGFTQPLFSGVIGPLSHAGSRLKAVEARELGNIGRKPGRAPAEKDATNMLCQGRGGEDMPCKPKNLKSKSEKKRKVLGVGFLSI